MKGLDRVLSAEIINRPPTGPPKFIPSIPLVRLPFVEPAEGIVVLTKRSKNFRIKWFNSSKPPPSYLPFVIGWIAPKDDYGVWAFRGKFSRNRILVFLPAF